MDQHLQILWNLLSALAAGLLIGIERGWSGRKEDEGDRVAGIRTFSLVGLLGGIWGQLSSVIAPWLLAAVFLAFAALVVTSYVMETKFHEQKDLGITTEISLLITFSLGLWSAFGYHVYALGTAVAVAGLLSLKPILHRWLQTLEVKEIYAGLKLLVISVILLPLLPNEGYGPWGSINPYWIWWMVVLISGLSFVGYFLIKYMGERLGTLLTAITGALASSTAVTISLAQFAKKQRSASMTLFIGGVLVASAIMFVRVLIEVAVVNSALLNYLWFPLSVMLFTAGGSGIWLWQKYNNNEQHEPELQLKNPLQLLTALQFGIVLGVILFLATALEKWFGEQGIYLLSVISGLMDVDAITLSLSRMAQTNLDAVIATSGIILAAITNTIVKAGLFIFWVGYEKSKPLIWFLLLTIGSGAVSMLFFLWL